MKYFLPVFFLIITFVLTTSTQAISQSNSVSVEVSAQVLDSIELTTLRNMTFENIQPSQNEINISPIQDANAGKMVASGIPNTRIRIQFMREWQLTNSRGGTPLTFYYQVAGNEIDEQSTAELLQTDNRNLEFNNEGEFYFWIGGSVDISEADPGNYEGEFTIEIEYI